MADAVADARLAVDLCGTSWEAGIVLAFGSYVLASAGEASRAAAFAESWIGIVREGGFGFGTSLAWPFVAQGFRILGRHQELVRAIDLLRVRTPWLECAHHIALGEHDAALAILRTIGGEAIAGFITVDVPALAKPSPKSY